MSNFNERGIGNKKQATDKGNPIIKDDTLKNINMVSLKQFKQQDERGNTEN